MVFKEELAMLSLSLSLSHRARKKKYAEQFKEWLSNITYINIFLVYKFFGLTFVYYAASVILTPFFSIKLKWRFKKLFNII